MKKINQRVLWGIWALLATGSGIAYAILSKTEAVAVVLPTNIEQVEVIRADATLTFIAKPDWQLNDKPAPKFGKWLALLPQACHTSYPAKDIQDSEQDAVITLRINKQDEWKFGGYNSYNHSHYLIHNDTAYLCSEQLKPRLTLPASYWQANDD